MDAIIKGTGIILSWPMYIVSVVMFLAGLAIALIGTILGYAIIAIGSELYDLARRLNK